MSRFQRMLGFLAAVIGAVLLLMIALSFHSIFSHVRAISRMAEAAYGIDRTDALIALMQSDEFSYTERNRAIWALGQLGDKRALPALEDLSRQTSGQAKPVSPDAGLSKYSLEKAIRQIRGGFMATRWMYHFL